MNCQSSSKSAKRFSRSLCLVARNGIKLFLVLHSWKPHSIRIRSFCIIDPHRKAIEHYDDSTCLVTGIKQGFHRRLGTKLS